MKPASGARRGTTQSPQKPRKRPSQARAKFTVAAIYDAFVRIWKMRGWAGVTTRAVALEAGISVGALYEYFPGKQALLSGYLRHCTDALIEVIGRDIVAVAGQPWRERIHQLVTLTLSMSNTEVPYFDAEMVLLGYAVAEVKHHRRIYEELTAAWLQAVAACSDLPRPAAPELVRALFAAAWGGRRYLLLVDPRRVTSGQWVEEMQDLCCAMLA
jgi:AcrR family transcriptional regulator